MFIFIALLSLIWLLVTVWFERYGKISDKVVSSMLYSLVFACIGVLSVTTFRDVRCVEVSRVNCATFIHSLRNLDTVDGSFFLGSGGIGHTEYYAMFAQDARGGLVRVTVNANEANIFQRDGEKPHLFWQEVYYKPNPWLIIWPKVQWMQRTRYDIIVPKKTVVEQYRLN